MANQPEARLQRKIQDALKKEYGFDLFVFKVHGSVHMMAGLPDLVGCYKGRFFGLEVKMPGGKTSERQKLVHEWLVRAGAICAVVHSVDQAVAALVEVI